MTELRISKRFIKWENRNGEKYMVCIFSADWFSGLLESAAKSTASAYWEAEKAQQVLDASAILQRTQFDQFDSIPFQGVIQSQVASPLFVTVWS